MSRRGVIGVAMGAGAVMAALVVASTADGPPLLSRPRSDESMTRVPTTTIGPSTTIPSATATTTGATGWDPSPIFGALLARLLVLLGLGLLALLALAVRAVILKTRPEVHTHDEAGFGVPELPADLLSGAEARLSALGEGDPRNAIVAAWVDLEVAAGSAGLPRDPAETSTEYTTRVLGIWSVDPGQLEALAALYREARFSTHDLTEDHRARAVSALRAVHADLGRSAQTQPPAQSQTQPQQDGAGR